MLSSTWFGGLFTPNAEFCDETWNATAFGPSLASSVPSSSPVNTSQETRNSIS